MKNKRAQKMSSWGGAVCILVIIQVCVTQGELEKEDSLVNHLQMLWLKPVNNQTRLEMDTLSVVVVLFYTLNQAQVLTFRWSMQILLVQNTLCVMSFVEWREHDGTFST